MEFGIPLAVVFPVVKVRHLLFIRAGAEENHPASLAFQVGKGDAFRFGLDEGFGSRALRAEWTTFLFHTHPNLREVENLSSAACALGRNKWGRRKVQIYSTGIEAKSSTLLARTRRSAGN